MSYLDLQTHVGTREKNVFDVQVKYTCHEDEKLDIYNEIKYLRNVGNSIQTKFFLFLMSNTFFYVKINKIMFCNTS